MPADPAPIYEVLPRHAAGPTSRSRSRRSPRARAPAPSSWCDPGQPVLGTLGDPDLDRVVARDALGRARRRAHVDPSLRPARRGTRARGLGLHRVVLAAASARSSSARSTSPPRWLASASCSATGSPCATPARCSPRRRASRWPTRSSTTGPTATSRRWATGSARATPCACSPTTPSSTSPRSCRPSATARRLHRCDGLAPHARHARRAAARGRARRRRARPRDGADRARHRRPHARGDRDRDLRRDHRPPRRRRACRTCATAPGPSTAGAEES